VSTVLADIFTSNDFVGLSVFICLLLINWRVKGVDWCPQSKIWTQRS